MGMYDSVFATCPTCKQGQIEFQSKSGECCLSTYPMNAVPVAIAEDLEGELAPSRCSQCGALYKLAPDSPFPRTVSMHLADWE